MKTLLRILVIEDSEDDALLVLHQVGKSNFNIYYERIQAAEEMRAALAEKTWDIILCDYQMPHFTGLEALSILKESGLDIPLIIISGTIGEEVAVETMRAGAYDYLMKDNLKRLIPAIERELLESKNREERKLAEEALKKQYSTLRGIIDSTDALIFSLDRNFCYTSYNRWHSSVMKALYGKEICIGECLLDYMTVAEDREKARHNLEQVLEGKPVIQEEYSGEEGRTRLFFQVSHNPIKTDEGEIIGIAVFAQDISDRKQAEKTFFEGQQVFRTLVENSPDIIARYDSNCQRTYVNPMYLKVAQIEQESLLSTSPAQRSPLPPESAAILMELVKKVLKTGIAEAVDVIWPKEDNIDYWYNIYATPEFDRDGNVVSVMTTSRDITKRKHAEGQVLKLNRIYAVLSNINEAIVRIRDSKEIIQEACRVTIEYGKFKMAWIGMINPQTNMVDVVASHGFTGDYLEKINIDLNDDIRSSGPTGLAVRTGKYKISNDVQHDKIMSPWQADAIKYGYLSVASFPLIVFKKTIGAFTIYDSELNSFHTEEINLLDEMANDISFALEFIESETNRKLAEEAMRASEERYRLIAENTADTISVLDMDLNFKYISPSILNLRGYTAAEAITQKLDQIFLPESLVKVQHLYVDQLAIEAEGKADPYRSISLELQEYCKDGTTIWVEVTMSFIRDANLNPIQILTVTRDITERIKAEEDLREYKTATQQSPASIIITNINGSIEYVNPKFTEISGYTFEEIKGKNPRILKSGEMSNNDYKIMWNTILAGEEWRGEFHNKKKDGTLYWESASISAIKDNEGKIIHFIAVKEDISHRKIMEIDLLEAKEKAEEMSRLKSSLLLNMSHELRTPMNGILGFSSLLKERALDPESLKMVDFICSSGMRLMTTLNSILDLAQVEAGKQNIQISPVNLSELLRKIQPIYFEQAENKKLSFNSNIENDIFSLVDERLLQNVLHHLIDNAIKFTDAGSVSLTLKKEIIEGHSFASIKVKDTGIGIPPEKMGVIFDAFRQVSEGIGRSFEGTGLGLTLCKKFVDILDGEIGFESIPDIGSTFTVRFPLLITDPEKPDFQSLNTETPDQDLLNFSLMNSKMKVLVVEDNDQICALLEIYLNPFCNSDIAHSGKQAVKLAFVNQYDLILMDINLGLDMDGIQATREIRNMDYYKNIPIIAVSGFSTVEEKTKILANGIDHLLTKPFTREELVKAIRIVKDTIR